jgi:signal transduction histidine kinase
MNSLRLRMFSMVFVVVAAAVATVSALAGQGTTTAVQQFVYRAARRDQYLAADLLAGGIATNGFGGGAGPGLRVAQDEFQARAELLGAAMGTDILLVNETGEVLVDSANWRRGQAMPVPPEWPSPADPWVFVADQPAFVVLGYEHQPEVVTLAASEMAVTDTVVFFGSSGPETGGLPFTPVLSSLPNLQADTILQGFNRNLLLAAGAGGGVALVLTAVLSGGILGPVESLTRAARRMEQGDRSQRVEVRSNDEIGELAHAFNAMADSVSKGEQLRRQMVNDIAHELRTPLTNIRGYLEAVRDGILEPRPDVIASLHEESMLLNRLVADLQELALAEAGQLKLKAQPVALRDVAERAACATQRHGEAGPAIRLDLPADLPLVQADPERIGQVLRNLLENALQHTPAGGAITIAARAQAAGVEVSVSDTGTGIAPEHLPKVFERFYRADLARARATGGAGLGLAIVRQLVEAHGGAIQVSSAPGKGTKFTFSLPYDRIPSDF